MPKLKNALPKYRRHRASGQAVVAIGGHDVYLGKYGTTKSKTEYDRVVGEWVSQGRPPLGGIEKALTVSDLSLRYWRHAERYYVKNGRQTDEVACIRAALRHVKALYGRTDAADFGPLALKAVRERMIGSGNARKYVNKQVGRIKRMFSWGVENELIPATVAYGLREVKGLTEGRTEARETAPVEPVDDEVVNRTVEYLPIPVAAMVRFQRLTGCRPEDVCRMRPCDLDRSVSGKRARSSSLYGAPNLYSLRNPCSPATGGSTCVPLTAPSQPGATDTMVTGPSTHGSPLTNCPTRYALSNVHVMSWRATDSAIRGVAAPGSAPQAKATPKSSTLHAKAERIVGFTVALLWKGHCLTQSHVY